MKVGDQMRKIVIAMLMVMVMLLPMSSHAMSDKERASQIASDTPGAYVERVVTVSKGGCKGKVKGTSYSVKYPKKVKKGKRVTVYMVVDGDDVVAMVCLGKVK